jgi:hypothetical protein
MAMPKTDGDPILQGSLYLPQTTFPTEEQVLRISSTPLIKHKMFDVKIIKSRQNTIVKEKIDRKN